VTDSATFTTPEASDEDLGDLLLEVLPPDGSTNGNLSARVALGRAAEANEKESEETLITWANTKATSTMKEDFRT